MTRGLLESILMGAAAGAACAVTFFALLHLLF